ncbi:hypothetical protein C8R44DRAFT_586915, partial [Mycena epipterygia]
THTYLDGIGPFTSLGLWAVGILHSTATLSSLYGLRLMHRLNISCLTTATRLGRPFF